MRSCFIQVILGYGDILRAKHNIPGTVTDVSAMLVASTNFRAPSSVQGAKAALWAYPGNAAYSGLTLVGASEKISH